MNCDLNQHLKERDVANCLLHLCGDDYKQYRSLVSIKIIHWILEINNVRHENFIRNILTIFENKNVSRETYQILAEKYDKVKSEKMSSKQQSLMLLESLLFLLEDVPESCLDIYHILRYFPYQDPNVFDARVKLIINEVLNGQV